LNKFPEKFYFTGVLLFFIVFHLMGNLASAFSDGVILAILFLIMNARKDE